MPRVGNEPTTRGNGRIFGGTIAWRAGEFHVRAIDRLKENGALGLVLEDPKVRSEVVALRESGTPPKKETPSVIKVVVDAEGKGKPDMKSNTGAVEAVIQAQGGGTKK